MVILPEYQGIGLGTNLLSRVAQYNRDMGYDFMIITSSIAMIKGLSNSDEWVATRYGKVVPITGKTLQYKNHRNVKTATFFYVGHNH